MIEYITLSDLVKKVSQDAVEKVYMSTENSVSP